MQKLLPAPTQVNAAETFGRSLVGLLIESVLDGRWKHAALYARSLRTLVAERGRRW